jgi:hypothetical protein
MKSDAELAEALRQRGFQVPADWLDVPAAPAADPDPGGRRRHVVIDVGRSLRLTLGQLLELAELTGVDPDVLIERVSSGSKTEVIRAAMALAVIQERERDPGVTLEDARLWDITVVGERDGAETGNPTSARAGLNGT